MTQVIQMLYPSVKISQFPLAILILRKMQYIIIKLKFEQNSTNITLVCNYGYITNY